MNDGNGDGTFQVQRGSETDKIYVEFDQDEIPVSIAIVKTMAEITGENPLVLPPLVESIDMDSTALDRLFEPGQATVGRGNSQLTCTYLEHRITVHSDGYMVIVPRDDDRRAV